MRSPFFGRDKDIKPGPYYYRDGPVLGPMKLTLRVGKDMSSTLVVNASHVIHANETATAMLYFLVRGHSRDEIIGSIKRRYRVKRDILKQDLDGLVNTVKKLAASPEMPPEIFLQMEREDPDFENLEAPYRMDLALTYRCSNHCGHCYVPPERKKSEMGTEEWLKVLDRLEEIGIPHVSFTGGEATLRKDLEQLVVRAEDLGIVTGLITNGRKLADKTYTSNLVRRGLDHFQITLESHDPKVHDAMVGVKGAWEETVDGIKAAVATSAYAITNTTLTKKNIKNIEKTVEFAASLDTEAFAFNSIIYAGRGENTEGAIREEDLEPIINRIKAKAEEVGIRLLWYTPTQYCHFNPIEAGLGIKTCSAGGTSMAIEPDGTVIPCQSYFQGLGNILSDPWNKIWNHPLCLKLRSREYVMDKCRGCKDLDLCGGGCPLYIRKLQDPGDNAVMCSKSE